MWSVAVVVMAVRAVKEAMAEMEAMTEMEEESLVIETVAEAAVAVAETEWRRLVRCRRGR